jgi:DNA-binding transcriptional ArsR family regulator
VFENVPLAELALGRSTVRQRILALLMSDDATRLHLREIQRRVGTSPGTASRELARLVAAGLVDREAEGSQVYFRASTTPVAAMMRQLLVIQSDSTLATPPARIPARRRSRQITSAPEAEQPVEDSHAAAPGVPPTTPSPNVPPVRAGFPADTTQGAGEVVPAEPAAPARDPSLDGNEGVATSPEPLSPPDPLALVVAARFTAAIRPLYGERLKGVFLYGARASIPAPEDSDVELIVLLDVVDRYGDELERTSSICAQLSFELGLVVSRVFVAEDQWTDPGHGFVAVIRDGEVTS